MTKQEIADYMQELMAEATDGNKESIDENTNFFQIGISSIEALKIMNKLRKRLQVEISPVAMFEYKTIAEMSEYLYNCKEEENE